MGETSLIFTKLTVNYTKLFLTFVARKYFINNHLLPSKPKLISPDHLPHQESSCHRRFYLVSLDGYIFVPTFLLDCKLPVNRDDLLHLAFLAQATAGKW